MAAGSLNSHVTEFFKRKTKVVRSHFPLLMGFLLLAGCGSGGDDGPNCQAVGGNTVSGTISYQKRMITPEGFSGQLENRPVRSAPVEIRRSGRVVTAGITDDRGRYCVGFIRQTGGTNYRLVVTASNDALGIRVGTEPVYDAIEDAFLYTEHTFSADFKVLEDTEAATLNVTISAGVDATGPAGAFNVLDTISRGNVYFQAVTGKKPPPLDVFWLTGIQTGTFFIPKSACESPELNLLNIRGSCIFVEGSGEIFLDNNNRIVSQGDQDGFDDDIVLHEYGHALVDAFSTDRSPGGIHFLGDNNQDIRLAWSEGWATFFSSAVRNNPESVDSAPGQGPPFFAFSIDSNSLLYPRIVPDPLNPSAVYTTSEVAVASVLWDVFDSLADAEPFDTLSLGLGPIWTVLARWLEAPPPQTTMEAFWDGFGQVQPQFLPGFEDISQSRSMEFSRDYCETSDVCSASLITKGSDDTFQEATSIAVDGSSQHHTLFPEGDVDHVSFMPTVGESYRVETFRLANGADTYLEILYESAAQGLIPLKNGNGQLIKNDNVNNLNFKNDNRCATISSDTDTGGLIGPFCPNDDTVLPAKVEIRDFAVPTDCKLTESTCTLYARVSRSPDAPPSAGRFGSYDISVTRF